MVTFSALLAICARNSPVTGEFPAQRPVTRSFDVFFDLRLNKRLSKQAWGWWFETLSCPLWSHCNDYSTRVHLYSHQILFCPCILSVICVVAFPYTLPCVCRLGLRLTHCGSVCGDIYLGKHWLKWWLDTRRHQTNIDLSFVWCFVAFTWKQRVLNLLFWIMILKLHFQNYCYFSQGWMG